MIAILYLFIAWAIHAATINPLTHLIGGGDGFIQGIASKTFATSFGSWNPYVQSGKYRFCRYSLPIILSAQPGHIIDPSEHLRIQFFPPHPLRAGGPLHVFLPGFASA